jgi:hypothetical protein
MDIKSARLEVKLCSAAVHSRFSGNSLLRCCSTLMTPYSLPLAYMGASMYAHRVGSRSPITEDRILTLRMSSTQYKRWDNMNERYSLSSFILISSANIDFTWLVSWTIIFFKRLISSSNFHIAMQGVPRALHPSFAIIIAAFSIFPA